MNITKLSFQIYSKYIELGSTIRNNLNELIPLSSRSYSIKSVGSSQSARFMNKIMGRNKRKGKFNFYENFKPSPGTSSFKRPVDKKRMSVLNKLFMKNITEVLATGSMSESIEGLGIDISRLSITPDFKNINVMYVCNRKDKPANLEELLSNLGFSLRHELSKLRLMGEVPTIQFLEDKTLQRFNELNKLLSEVDTGSDDADQPDELQEQPADQADVVLTQDAYGLYYNRMYDKIMAAKKASSFQKTNNNPEYIQEGVQYTPPVNITETPKKLPKDLVTMYLRSKNRL